MEDENKEILLRVIEISITGLFGIYNHNIPLKKDERITIIHGPNGIGKTALLRLTKALLSGNYSEIDKTPFIKFNVIFSDGSELGVEKINKKDKVIQTTLYYKKANEKSPGLTVTLDKLDFKKFADRIEKESPYLVRADEETWVDRRSDENFSASEVVARFSEEIPERIRNKILREVSPELKKFQGNVFSNINVHLIEAQRLIKFFTRDSRELFISRERGIIETVHEYSKDLKNRISDTLKAYGKESQKLDQTFPQRFINLLQKNSKSVEQLKEDFKIIEKHRSDLKNIGLLDDTEDSNHPFSTSSLEGLDPTQLSAMDLYIDDSRKKLATLHWLSERIKIFLEILNFKFLNKSISIHKEFGLVAMDINDNKISLSSLSSGEQQEIVLLYDLLFKVEKNTLVLIDEPELSLHVNWQDNFLSDIEKIIKLSQFDVLLATHSPYIIGDRKDLMVKLSYQSKKDNKNIVG